MGLRVVVLQVGRQSCSIGHRFNSHQGNTAQQGSEQMQDVVSQSRNCGLTVEVGDWLRATVTKMSAAHWAVWLEKYFPSGLCCQYRVEDKTLHTTASVVLVVERCTQTDAVLTLCIAISADVNLITSVIQRYGTDCQKTQQHLQQQQPLTVFNTFRIQPNSMLINALLMRQNYSLFFTIRVSRPKISTLLHRKSSQFVTQH